MKTTEQLRKDIHQIKKSNRSQHSAIKQVLSSIIDILDHHELISSEPIVLNESAVYPIKLDMGEPEFIEEKPKNQMDDLASAILGKKGKSDGNI